MMAVSTVKMVAVKFADNTEPSVFPATELVAEGETFDRVMGLPDAELTRRIAAYLNVSEAQVGALQIRRPSEGNIVLAPKAVYG